MSWKKRVCALITIVIIANIASATGFSWKDTKGKYLDLLYDGSKVSRYIYDYDESSEQRTFETYKVLHHVFDAEGAKLLTNGPDGEHTYAKSIKFPHHRGIYIGWNKLLFQGKNFDTWHMTNGVRQVHQKFLKQSADEDKASCTALIHWKTGESKVMIEEKRTTTVYRRAGEKILILDFKTELKAANGEVKLDGDPEHAGFQYRAHNDVATGPTENKAKYLFDKDGLDLKKDTDLPWVAMSYGLNGNRYSVVYMKHPDNPEGAIYSAYRDYGRFGSYFKKTIKAGETLTLNYGVIVLESEMPSRQKCQNIYKEYVKRTK